MAAGVPTGSPSPSTGPPAEDPDDVIKAMLTAAPYELPGLVSRSLKTVSSPTFFVRIAELSDAAKTEDDKKALSSLATNLVNTLEVIVQRTEEKVDGASTLLQEILAGRAREHGAGCSTASA